MKLVLQLRSKEKIDKRINKTFLYFISFLYSISTGELTVTDLFNTARNAGYGYYTKLMNEAYNIGIEWKYGLTNACEIIAKNKKKDIQSSQLMMKLAQVLRLGESLSLFLKHEFATVLKLYSSEYERRLESMKMILSIYSSIASTSVFMISASMLMSMISGGDGTFIVILISLAIMLGLGVFAYLMYSILPRDELLNEQGDITKIYNKLFYICVGLSISISVILIIGNILEPLLAIAASSPPLIILGFYAKKIEKKVLIMNGWYPTFIRQFGEIYATIGSVGNALRSTLKNNFGPLTKPLSAMLNRIENRVSIETAFELFSKESGNSIITNSNTIIAVSIIKGANMNIVGNLISELTITLNELYNKRIQVAKVFESTLLIMHILSLSVLSFMNSLAVLFTNMLNNNTTNIIQFGSIDPNVLNGILPLIVVITSIVNGLVTKIAKGGLYKTAWFNIGLFMLLGSLVVYVSDMLMTTMLNSIINLDFLT